MNSRFGSNWKKESLDSTHQELTVHIKSVLDQPYTQLDRKGALTLIQGRALI